MNKLPFYFENFFPNKRTGANVTCSYWFEFPHSEGLLGLGLFVSLAGPEDFTGERVAKFMWDSFRETFEEEVESDSVPDILRKSIKAARNTLVELIKNETSVSEQGVDLHLATLVVLDSTIYLSSVGEPDFILVRNGKVVNLKEMLPKYDGNGYRSQISIGNFETRSSDILLISTPKLLSSSIATWQETEASSLEVDNLRNKIYDFSSDLSGNQYIWFIGNGEIFKTIAKSNLDLDDDAVISDMPDDVTEENGKEDSIGTGRSEFESDSNIDENEMGRDNSDKGKVISNQEKRNKVANENKALDGLKDKGMRFLAAAKNRTTQLFSKIKTVNVVENVKRFIPTNIFKDGFNFKAIKRNVNSWISNIKMGKGRRRKMFVTRTGLPATKGKNTKYVVAILIIVIVGLVGLLMYRSYQKRVYRAAVVVRVSDVEELLVEAQNAWNINKNKDSSENLILQLQKDVEDLRNEDLLDEQKETLNNIEKQALSLYDKINKISPLREDLRNIEIILDAYLTIGDDVVIADIEKRGEYIYMTEQTKGALYRYKIGGTSAEIVANSEQVMKKPTSVAIDDHYIFVYDEELGVVSMDLAGVGEFVIKPEFSQRSIGSTISDIAVFGGNLYLLDSAGGRVLRAMPVGSGFTYPTEYFRESYLKGALRMLIDGNIYVLTNSGEKIFKFYIGQRDNFQLSGLDRPLGDVCCGYTNHFGEKPIWLFDKTNKRIVVIEKGSSENNPGMGIMTSQMVYRGDREDIFKDVRELVADIDGKYLYILDGTRVLRVSLDHVQ